MAARTTTDEPTQAKPKSDAYTGMLAISLIVLLTGCALLYFDYKRYPSQEPPPVIKVSTTAQPPK
jgi:hypothetical protein